MNSPYAVAAFGIILTALIAYVVRLGNTISEMKGDIREMSVKISPLWATVQAGISRDLHHPTARYAEMDKLLEKLEALTITANERERLKVLLLERSTDMHPDVTEDQRKKAKLMIGVMEIVLLEKNNND
jgi:hypothetical protein